MDHLLELQPKAEASKQADTVRELITRLIPKQAHLFEVIVDGAFVTSGHLDKFKIENTTNNTIRITGTTGVAVANGLHYYLKHVANCSTSWSGDQLRVLPVDKLPEIEKSIEIVIRDKLRYYMNTCTLSYSMVWWDWARWQREIDWMALRGINLPLAFGGQEIVFRRVFEKHYNLNQKEIDDYFTGPAFLAWNRMGNMQTWSGPLSENWHKHQEELQKQILGRMRSFGMYPVVPGFAGHVPRTLQKVLPDAKIERLSNWASFGMNYSHTYFLQPEDPEFGKLNKLFIQEYISLYGSDHFYNIDLFNELTPSNSDPLYLEQCGKRVYDSIIAADPKGIWLMQGWLFYYEPDYWKQPQVKAIVTSVPMGKMLILDLYSEIEPVYTTFDGYYGQSFLWCMLHNFGGAKGMYGALNKINDKLFKAREDYPNMLGVGLTMEGIEQNDVAYEYMMETIWHEKEPDQEKWFSGYAFRRYGLHNADLDQAWQILRKSVYHDTIGIHNHGRYTINRRPQLTPHRAKRGPSTGHSPLWYQPKDLADAFNLMATYLNAHTDIVNQSEAFVYDMVDVSRQALQLVFDHYLERQMLPEFNKKETEKLKKTAEAMLGVLDLFEQILQCSNGFLLHDWIEKARALGADAKEKDNYEWGARNQVTIWGPNANIVDYANKHWSGLVSGYYKPRWQLFLSSLVQSLESGTEFSQAQFNVEVFDQVELPFTQQTNQTLVDQPQTHNLLPLVAKVVLIVSETLNKQHTPAEMIAAETHLY